MSRSGDIRYLCALVASMSDWLRREPHLLALVVRTGTPEAALRREVEALAHGGEAVDLARRYLAGQEIPVAVLRSVPSPGVPAVDGDAEPTGWWNREPGATETHFEFIYRTRYRLRMAAILTEWERVGDWLDRAGGYLEALEWPWNEIRSWNEIKAEHLSDPVAREAHEMRHGVTLYEEDDTDYALLYGLEGELIDLAMARGWDWWEEYEGAVADGIPPELAAAKLIGLADR